MTGRERETETGRSRPRILIVDDVPSNIKSLNAILVGEYDTSFATDWEKALELAGRTLPDLILLDIMMPGMDGFEICRRLKSDPVTRDIPIIFVTALAGAQDEEKGLAMGAADYITKPFGAAIVKLRVRNHLMFKKQRDRLAALTMTDELTEIPNRRRFEQHLEEEWRRAVRQGNPLSAVMIDLDRFKAFNDNYGHAAGDDCLRTVAQTLERVPARPGDLVARFGGEEFVSLLPGADEKGSMLVARRFHRAVAELNIAHAFSSVAGHVTISAGVATVQPTRDGDSAARLIQAADERLYEAKKAGRNRVVGP